MEVSGGNPCVCTLRAEDDDDETSEEEDDAEEEEQKSKEEDDEKRGGVLSCVIFKCNIGGRRMFSHWFSNTDLHLTWANFCFLRVSDVN